MGFIQKRNEEEREEIEGIQIIERSDVPDDLPQNDVDLVEGPSAESIACGRHFSGENASQEEEAGSAAASQDKAPAEDVASQVPVPSVDEDPDADGAASADEPKEGADAPRRRSRMPLFVAGAVIAVIVAAILGYVVGSGGLAPHSVEGATVTEAELDTPLARYTYNGAEHTISVREAIESQYSLDVAQTDDGSYTVPSAEVILTEVRNRILTADAEARGIEASDDELASNAEETLGTSDFAEIAEQYQISEEQAREIVRENVLISKLYEQIAPTDTASMPTQPTAPENGDESTSSPEYATYIINLLGDEWDSSTGTWARTDGAMYAAIGGADFDGQTATYAQATAAFYVAYQAYYETASTAQQAWTTYANNLYAQCDLTLLGVFQ